MITANRRFYLFFCKLNFCMSDIFSSRNDYFGSWKFALFLIGSLFVLCFFPLKIWAYIVEKKCHILLQNKNKNIPWNIRTERSYAEFPLNNMWNAPTQSSPSTTCGTLLRRVLPQQHVERSYHVGLKYNLNYSFSRHNLAKRIINKGTFFRIDTCISFWNKMRQYYNYNI